MTDGPSLEDNTKEKKISQKNLIMGLIHFFIFIIATALIVSPLIFLLNLNVVLSCVLCLAIFFLIVGIRYGFSVFFRRKDFINSPFFNNKNLDVEDNKEKKPIVIIVSYDPLKGEESFEYAIRTSLTEALKELTILEKEYSDLEKKLKTLKDLELETTKALLKEKEKGLEALKGLQELRNQYKNIVQNKDIKEEELHNKNLEFVTALWMYLDNKMEKLPLLIKQIEVLIEQTESTLTQKKKEEFLKEHKATTNDTNEPLNNTIKELKSKLKELGNEQNKIRELRFILGKYINNPKENLSSSSNSFILPILEEDNQKDLNSLKNKQSN